MERVAGLLQALPREKAQMLRALHLVQEELGWVPREAMELVARHLRITAAQVYGAATYYAEYRLTPPPRTLVTWCNGPSCRVQGGERVRRILEAVLGCGMGQNSPGGAYGLWSGQCNGTCERAPMIWVNGRVLGPLSMSRAVEIARRIKAGEEVVRWPQAPVKIAQAHFQGVHERYHEDPAPATAHPEVAQPGPGGALR